MCQRVLLTIILFLVSVSLADAFQVPDTGIVECYDAAGNQIFPCPAPGEPYYGQDGNLAYNSMSFTDNGNGTLTDNVTGLTWQQTDVADKTWAEAVDYCNNLDLGGHTDWQLPALVELDSIMDLSVDTDTGAAAINPIFTGTAAAGYWTSTEDPDDSAQAWILDFGTTEDDTVAKSDTNYTRCVLEVTP